jgi:hypothetical protein
MVPPEILGTELFAIQQGYGKRIAHGQGRRGGGGGGQSQ